MNTNYRVGDPVPAVGTCGHELTVEHVIVPGARQPDDARETARYYSLFCFHPGCERRYGWRGSNDIPQSLSR